MFNLKKVNDDHEYTMISNIDERDREYIYLKEADEDYFLKRIKQENSHIYFNREQPGFQLIHSSTIRFKRKIYEKTKYLDPIDYKRTRLLIREATLVRNLLNAEFKKIPFSTFIKNNFSSRAMNYFQKKIKDIVKDEILEIGCIHGDLMSNNILKSKLTGDIIFIDWESFRSNYPLIVDKIGSLDFIAIKSKYKKAICKNKNTLTKLDKEILLFVLITSLDKFRPSMELINE